MSNDEKMCPMTKMTCYGAECGMWHIADCAVISAARNLNSIGLELFHLRTELTFIRRDISELERRL